MKVLVTGGTGVVGHGAVTALVESGHTVRILSRHAERDARQWSEGVEPWVGNVADPDLVRGSAEACDAVLHLVGIVEESPPEATFERVNVEGTRTLLREAERAGVGRFIFVSSLGAERGESDYHRSKRAAETIVREFDGDWLILRPGSVYGPGDGEVSLVLKMVRTLPAVPLLGDGEQEFQPIWHEDLARALAMAVERDDLARRTLDLAGTERTTQRDLVRRFSEITGRSPAVLPVPQFMASLGTRVAELMNVEAPLSENQITMIREGNVIPDDRTNALVDVFGIVPTPLDEGLRRLADAQPEQFPSEGIGSVKRKRFWAEIRGSRYDADALFSRFRMRFAEILPVEVGPEPGTKRRLEEGETITMSLPLRGHIQVRVEEIAERSVTMCTLEGHPLAGAVRFLFEERGDRIRFEVQVYDRAATLPDLVVMRTVGDLLQNSNWIRTVERMIDESGGTAPDGVEMASDTLDGEQLDRIEDWLEDLVARRKRHGEGEDRPRVAP